MSRIFTKKRRPVLEFIGQTILVMSIIAAILYGTRYYPPGLDWHLLVKTLPVGLLALYALINTRTPDHLLLVLALGMCAVGDLSLELPVEDAFMRGIAGFTAGHLMYMILFFRNLTKAEDISSMRLHLASFLWVLATISAIYLYPSLGDLKWQVIGYIIVLTGMTSAALLSRYPVRIVGLGAIFFFISDAFLGANNFLDVPAWFGYLVWIFYYAGQFLLAIGVMLAPDKERRYPLYNF